MARLIVADEWVGRGEKKAAAIFERDLPPDWTVIAGKKLPDEGASDVDFIIIGKNYVFVVEEKAWRGVIVVNDETWELKTVGRTSKNPLKGTAYKGRILRSHLDDRIAGFSTAIGKNRPVKHLVVMSDDLANIIGAQTNTTLGNVFRLKDVVEEILKMDLEKTTGLLAFREKISSTLTELPNSDDNLKWIRDYEVLQVLDDLPNQVKVFRGSHKYTGHEVILKCYPQFLFGQDDPRTFFNREIDALTQVGTLDRTWKLADAFDFEARNWFCVATELPFGNRTLRKSVSQNDPARVEGALEQSIFENVALDAFNGLASIHESGLVHRGISPDRIWLGQSMRVFFGDFNLCHIDEAKTVLHWVYSDPNGEGFRAPECEESLAYADHKSDVYSLALVIAGWANGSFNASFSDLLKVCENLGEVGNLLASALNGEPGKRPSSSDLCSQIEAVFSSRLPVLEAVNEQNIEQSPENSFQLIPGAKVGENGRFELIEKLGSGGEATSWKAFDINRGYHVVLKFLHSTELYSFAQREHLAVHDLYHPRLARSFDIQPKPEPGYLVQEYKDGCALGDRSQFSITDTNQLRSIAIALFEILEYLESKRIVHADLTPNNIIIFEGMPSLIDFGLTTPDGQPALGYNKVFAAPEVQAKRRVSHLSDIYGAACSLLDVALGRRPHGDFPAEGKTQQPIHLTSEESEIWGPDGTAILNALFRGIDPDPNSRPNTATEFKKLLISARAIPELQVGVTARVNPNVDELRKMYRASKLGNSGNRGLDTQFAKDTYVRTKLDDELIPRIISGEFAFVALTGNPGDGKTALIKTLQESLGKVNAEFLESTPTRWVASVDGHKIVAILDASESNGDLSSDENLKWALEGIGDKNLTAVIAANDGRLLDFFTRFEHVYEDLAVDVQRAIQAKPPLNPRNVVIDLKARALIGLDRKGPALEILDSVTNDAIWTTCHDCALNTRCSIFSNRNSLQGQGRMAIADLLLTSHLRGRRRFTIRDIKSAISWMITGDIGCKDVENASKSGRNLLFEQGTMLHNLAFDPQTTDQLLSEWSTVDPAKVISPATERRFRELTLDDPNHEYVALGVESFKRKMFAEDASERVRLSPYVYLEKYLSVLGDSEILVLPQLLLGLSRIVGAHGFSSLGLAVADKYAESSWSVLKVANAHDFELQVAGYQSEFIESIPDHALLVHKPTQARLRITLDLGEILMRASEGEIMNDIAIDSYYQELIGFATVVGRERTDHAVIVDSNSRAWRVAQVGSSLTLEAADGI
jgi:serine/threonine protein kinase